MKSQQTALFELQAMATVALRNYQVWWGLVNRVLPTYEKTLNLYSDFFIVTTDSCKRVFLLELGRLLDERRGVMSLKAYFAKYLVKNTSIKSEFEDCLGANKKAIDAIRIIRNKAIAHQDGELDIDGVFKAASISPNEIRTCLENLVDIVRKLIRDGEAGAGQISDTLRYEYATMALVKDIHDWHHAIPKQNRKVWLTAPFHIA